ncbi:hypothetical protein [Peribacillus sp. Hz7]|uniref:hypothetical protein n=1 Tax=Peribacillus sp. Hz7 TaxID=3344873 RepID=UPI0035CC1BE7
MTTNEKQLLPFVHYHDAAYGYVGYGVFVSEDVTFIHVTNIIGAMLVSKHSVYTVKDLPTYSLLKTISDWHTVTNLPFVIEDWMIDFPVERCNADEIHHIGLFFEWFASSNLPLDKRLERCIEVSALEKKILKTVIHFIIHHHKGNTELLNEARDGSLIRPFLCLKYKVKRNAQDSYSLGL